MSQFDCVPADVWQLREDISSLGSPPYEQIVQLILTEAAVIDHKRERAKTDKHLFRVIVTLKCSVETVAMFHSARSGYRAQYYSSITCGERANQFALQLLVPHVCRLLAGREKRTCPLWWVEKSLLNPAAKVWIHQGRWLRPARLVDRGLAVARWVRGQTDPNKKRRRKAIWSMLTPKSEHHLELKGAFLSLAGASQGTLKPTRSKDLYELGFT
jgi:hypothetical protein